MKEQERRAEYTRRTGRIATSDLSGYFAFCKGIEFEREECAALCEEMHHLKISRNHEWDDLVCLDIADAIRDREKQ
jgi:hypothetical protein